MEINNVDLERLIEARAPELESFHHLIKSRSKGNIRRWEKARKKRKTNNEGGVGDGGGGGGAAAAENYDDDDDVSKFEMRLLNDMAMLRSQRRRTTSHVRRSAVNRIRSQNRNRKTQHSQKKESDNGDDGAQKKLNRRARRRIQLKGPKDGGFACSGDGTLRLATHVWHAKRFRMIKKWGFYLPLGICGRGKGSKSLLKRAADGALVHDASYYSCVQLEGPEDSLLNVMRKTLLPAPLPVSSMSELQRAQLRGDCLGTAMLKKSLRMESGVIAPVIFIWCPTFTSSVQQDDIPNNMDDESAVLSREDKYSDTRRNLWIFIHAAAFDEALTFLQSACQKQTEEDSVQLKCYSRRGELGKLDIFGSQASELLKKVCRSVLRDNDNAKEFYLKSCKGNRIGHTVPKKDLLENSDKHPNGSVLFMEVLDPRIPSKVEKPISLIIGMMQSSIGEYNAQESSECCKESLDIFSKIEMAACTENIDSALPKTETSGENLNMESTGCTSSVITSQNDWQSFISKNDKNMNKLLWEPKKLHSFIEPPVSESLLCEKRHQHRLDIYCMDKVYGSETSTHITNDEHASFSSSCPVVLLKTENKKHSASGWSIILPLNWVKAFWIPLVEKARPIGLEERRWLMADAGSPSFPFDFPDCDAYHFHMNEAAAEYAKKMSLLPPSKRPPEILLPLPWHQLQRYQDFSTSYSDTIHLKDPTADSLMENSGLHMHVVYEHKQSCSLEEIPDTDNGSFLSQRPSPLFPGVVARTSASLKQYFTEINCCELLVFPEYAIKEHKSYFKLLEEGTIQWREKASTNIAPPQNLCFLRVVLNAPGRGNFEEGAVVCAPLDDDFESWCSRPQEWKGLEIPQSLRNSECKQQWADDRKLVKLESENPFAREGEENLRMPIGFITTGFSHGSVSALAAGICEATVLGKLRAEQWNERKWREKSEIFVLVRNAKSTFYRPALATIVLEKDQDCFCW